MKKVDVTLETAAEFDAEFHVQRARAMRSAYLSELMSELFVRIRDLFHIKSHKMVSSH
jgi:DNA-binding GntR family transcriptional regulator